MTRLTSLPLNESPEFVECLAYSPDRAVVMYGDMVDSCQLDKLNEIGVWHKPWFFKHVEEFLHKGDSVEYIPLRHYYHRHSRYVSGFRHMAFLSLYLYKINVLTTNITELQSILFL